MCTRSDSISQLANMSQKRPLSIIDEQDGDDCDVNHNTNFLQGTEPRGGDTILSSKSILQPRKEIKLNSTNQKSTQIKRNSKPKKGHTKPSTKQSNTKLFDPPPIESISNFELCSNNLPSQPDSGNEDSNCSFTLTSESKGNNRKECVNSKEKIDDKISTDVITTQSNNNNKQQIQDEICSYSKNFQTTESTCIDNLRVTSLSPVGTSGELHKTETIEEETIQIASSTSSQHLLPEFLQRLIPTESSRNVHELRNSPKHKAVEITVTLVEGTHCAVSTSCISNTEDIDSASSEICVKDACSCNVKDACGCNVKDACSCNVNDTCSCNVKETRSCNVKDACSCNVKSACSCNVKDACSCNTSPHASPTRTCLRSNVTPTKKDPHLSSKRTSTDPKGTFLRPEITDFDVTASDSQDSLPMPQQPSDFRRLKETTEKLHLSTRRPSTMLWRQQYMDGKGMPGIRSGLNVDVIEERLTTERKQRIDDALEWLRAELQEMRSQDQNLARQLLTIRHDIHQLKLKRSTEEHQELIEEFQSELDDMQEFSDVLDFPQTIYGNNPLKHIGVTRLNMNARRFSAC